MKGTEKAALTEAQDNLLKCMSPQAKFPEIGKAFAVMEETFSAACDDFRAVNARESRLKLKD